jgi:tetratricopeptide (TPR) repeat protein
LFGLVLWAFLPVLQNNFINYDDPVYVTANAHVQHGLTWGNLGWAFSNLDAGFWHPLTWLSLMLDSQLFGLRPNGFHLTSLLLHAANAILVFLVFRRITGATWRSAGVAALFAVHPLHVEPVAWVSARKDLLSTLFWMLALLAYARYAQLRKVEDSKSKVAYGLTLLWFLCALMSKTMVVTLPLLLLLLDWWPLRRLQLNTEGSKLGNLGRLFLEKIPFFAASLVCGLVTVHAERELRALPTAAEVPALFRIANSLSSLSHYLVQTLWPADLAVCYPYPNTFPLWAILLAAALLLAVSILVVLASRSLPYLAFGWAWYLVTLLPVIGIIQIGAHAHADRYTYVPLVGIFVLLLWGANDLAQRWRFGTTIACFAGAAAILLCAVGARGQVRYWRNGTALFGKALAVDGNNYLAHCLLAGEQAKQGQLPEAILQFNQALRLKSRYPDAHNGLAIALCAQGHIDEGIKHFQEALDEEPDYAEAHNNLGFTLIARGLLDQAVIHLNEAVRLKPGYANAHRNLGTALFKQGRVREAVEHYQKALQLRPDSAEAHQDLAGALLKEGDLDEAMAHLQKAAEIDPKLGGTLSGLGDILVQKGRVKQAIECYQGALRAQPADARVLNNLAWMLATCSDATLRDGTRALDLARQAERVSGGADPSILGTVAAAYAEAGRLTQAVETAQRALALATTQTNRPQIEALRSQIGLYQAGSPCRDTGQTKPGNVPPQP